jgi:hypothetical protein
MLDQLNALQRERRTAIVTISDDSGVLTIVGPGNDQRVLHNIPASEIRRLKAEFNLGRQPIHVDGGTDGQRSSDGQWITFRDSNNDFVLVSTADNRTTTLFTGVDVLTPLYWSPDSGYLFFVQRSTTFDRSQWTVLSGGRDLMVYRIRDSRVGRIGQVFEQYPYQDLGWLIIPMTFRSKRTLFRSNG